MKDDNYRAAATVWFFAGLIAGAILAGSLVFWGHRSSLGADRQKAIDAGVGRWTIDPATGDEEFRYGASEANE